MKKLLSSLKLEFKEDIDAFMAGGRENVDVLKAECEIGLKNALRNPNAVFLITEIDENVTQARHTLKWTDLLMDIDNLTGMRTQPGPSGLILNGHKKYLIKAFA